MFDIGFAELLIVAVVALLVLGPEKLPTAVRTLGLWVGKVRRTVSGIQAEISEELRLDEIRRNAAIEKDQLERELAEMKAPFVAPDQASASENEKPAAVEHTGESTAGADVAMGSKDKTES